MSEQAFQLAMRAEPDDVTARLVFADWLDEQGDPRAELIRLTHGLTREADPPDRPALEVRLRELLTSGVRPVGPTWTNSVGITFVVVPPGSFLMGSPPSESDRKDDEKPHRVTIAHGFSLGLHPVTQAQWREVMGEDNPSGFLGGDRPVECVSWDDGQAFCHALNLREGLAGGSSPPYRLPTEAEWEYACRAGTMSAYFFGNTISPRQANFRANDPIWRGSDIKLSRETTPVGTFPANAWGLSDMHGNVYEWCADWFAPYPDHDVRDPLGGDRDAARVLRGGSWHSVGNRCRSACRGFGAPTYRGSDVGFRVCFRLQSDFIL